MTAAIAARMDGALFGAYPTPRAPSPHMERGTGGRSERQRQAALPGDIVLGLVEAVAVELVDEVATLGADADAPEAVLAPSCRWRGCRRSGAATRFRRPSRSSPGASRRFRRDSNWQPPRGRRTRRP